MIKIIKRDNLVENAAKVGGYLFGQLEEMQASGSGKGKISNLRGKGYVSLLSQDSKSAIRV